MEDKNFGKSDVFSSSQIRNHFMRNYIGEYIINKCFGVTRVSLIGCRIYGKNEFEARESKNSLVG